MFFRNGSLLTTIVIYQVKYYFHDYLRIYLFKTPSVMFFLQVLESLKIYFNFRKIRIHFTVLGFAIFKMKLAKFWIQYKL